ncbi:restriction endonuclease subunit S [Roseateles sp. DC23W]|uniref:Restriction endonuclease subunit S n=1 Tax=Pelomonas dachongensis TaxID=3299029 RepID=A0ABW7ERH9_9BURK
MTEERPNSHWASVSLGDVVTLINGRAYKQPEMLPEGTPILRIQNLNGGSRWFYSNLALPAEKYCHPGDLLYAWSATFGPYIYSGPKAIFHYHIWNVLPSVAIDKRFAFYELLRVTDQIKSAAHGVAMPHITKAGMEAWPLLLPPLAEQRRIADKLDSVLARVDAVNTRLARVASMLKRFRQSVLAAASSGKLTEEWRGSNEPPLWEATTVGEVAAVGTGSTPLRSNSEFFAATGTPWVTSAATGQPVINSAGEYVTKAAIAAHRLKRYPIGTLVVAMYGEGKTRGQVSELGIEATVNQACAAVVVNESLMVRTFVKRALQANYMEMREMAEGGNQPNLNMAKVKGFTLPKPPLEEQAEIVRRVDLLFGYAERLEARLQAAQTTAERLTPALLAKAFRGELVPQDPNDEPASALLKRLAASCDATTAPVGGRRRKSSAEAG